MSWTSGILRLLSFTAAIAVSRSMDLLANSEMVMTIGIEAEETVLTLGTETRVEGFSLDVEMGAVARGWRCFRCCILLFMAVK